MVKRTIIKQIGIKRLKKSIKRLKKSIKVNKVTKKGDWVRVIKGSRHYGDGLINHKINYKVVDNNPNRNYMSLYYYRSDGILDGMNVKKEYIIDIVEDRIDKINKVFNESNK